MQGVQARGCKLQNNLKIGKSVKMFYLILFYSIFSLALEVFLPYASVTNKTHNDIKFDKEVKVIIVVDTQLYSLNRKKKEASNDV